MIAILISIGIIALFSSEAKKMSKNPWKWSLIGLSSFWLSTMIPAFLTIEYLVEEKNDKSGIFLITFLVFVFLVVGSLTCKVVLKKLNTNSNSL